MKVDGLKQLRWKVSKFKRVTEDGLKVGDLEIFSLATKWLTVISLRLTNYHFGPLTKVTVYRENYGQYDRHRTKISLFYQNDPNLNTTDREHI